MSSRSVNTGAGAGPGKLTEQQRVDLINEFFEYRDTKVKFPILKQSLLDEAISQDFLPYEERDKILRDPNKLSIFFVNMNPESPRTKEALFQLNLDHDACQIMSFMQFQNSQLHPIQNLISYMEYLQDKYKELLKILHTRNKLKKLGSTKNKTSMPTVNSTQLFITDVHKSGALSKSINTRSIDFLQTSFDEKLEIQKKKQEEYLKIINRHKKLEDEQLKTLQDYYQAKVPIRESRVKKVQQENTIKIQEHKLKIHERSAKTLSKIKILEQEDVEHRKKVKDQIIRRQQQIDLNKSQINGQYQQELQKQLEEYQKKEERRREIKLKAIQQELETMEAIMEKNYEREYIAEEIIQKMKDDQEKKKQLHKEQLIKAQKRVQDKQEQYQNQLLQQFAKNSDNNVKMVQEVNKVKIKHFEELKNKSQVQWQRVIKNKEKLGEEINQKIQSLRDKDDGEIQNRLEAIKSSIELRSFEQAQKNRFRLQRAQNNTQNFSTQYRMQQLQLIDKLAEENRKTKQMKQEQEKLKEATLKQHLELRQQVDKLI
ncbi:hypothetical protein pb186bvf_002500 [Paramecium bursaria]